MALLGRTRSTPAHGVGDITVTPHRRVLMVLVCPSRPSRRYVVGSALGAVGAGGVAACSTSGKPARSPSVTGSTPPSSPLGASTSSPSPKTTPPPQLPRGGRTIFPAHRLFGWCGAPGAPALGQLGVGDLNTEMDKMIAVAPRWGDGRAVLPVAELIATVVQGAPGHDGLFRTRIDDRVISTWLAAARKRKALCCSTSNQAVPGSSMKPRSTRSG